MTSRREELLDAAISVLGEHGARRLTHRAVDAAAGVPAGSTSNYFRTRDALVKAIVERFTAREQSIWEEIATTARPTTAAGLTDALAEFAVDATGPRRTLTLARYALFIEAAQAPSLQEHLTLTREHVLTWAAGWLEEVGSSDPRDDAALLLDLFDGLLLHQLASPDPAFDPAPRLSALIEILTAPRDRRRRSSRRTTRS
ncbi:TetR/AcrR family transcriptional regulator [Actinopolymorpha alba]|uniref:TetR/AcrR family transcriptional regulator n=1 Tax=Actinopolymorpha alba TaxID=533267 RepID=UPI0003661A30|nr:TetR/AcrR family transcriptional regulator [Actinopolymorpha alba]